jgi:hypothetical protein
VRLLSSSASHSSLDSYIWFSLPDTKCVSIKDNPASSGL